MAAERQIPGGQFVNETGTAQRQLPGGPFVNETVAPVAEFVRRVIVVTRAAVTRASRW